MIQRIQSIYLVLALFFWFSPYFFSFRTGELESASTIMTFIVLLLLIVSGISLITALLLFKFVEKQLKASKISLFSTFFSFLFFIVFKLNANYKEDISTWGKILPTVPYLLCTIFAFLALKAIQKDYDLLKSIDRIR